MRQMWLCTVPASEIVALRAWSGVANAEPGSQCGDVILYRTGRPWDFLVAVGQQEDHRVRLAAVLKNAVPLWQYEDMLPDGAVTPDVWARLRRAILIHNPGLPGALDWLVQR